MDRMIEVQEEILRLRIARDYYDTCPKADQPAALAAWQAAIVAARQTLLDH